MSVREAQDNPGYNDALRQAVRLAKEGSQAAVYWDGRILTVRSTYAPKPDKAETICIAQQWDERTVQLRFAGARSEWVPI